jgi:hypothetical protein
MSAVHYAFDVKIFKMPNTVIPSTCFCKTSFAQQTFLLLIFYILDNNFNHPFIAEYIVHQAFIHVVIGVELSLTFYILICLCILRDTLLSFHTFSQ